MARLNNILKWILNPFLVKKPEHVKVVVLCIAVATTFWFLNAFNKTYTTVFSYPINYQYNQDKFTPVNELKSNVKISLTGQGWDLLKEFFALDKKYIDIQLSDEPGTEIISTSRFENSVNELFKKFTVNQILADSIQCEMDYKISKLVHLHLNQDSININNGFAIDSSTIIISPNEIHITGPASEINKIEDTLELNVAEKVDEDYDEDIQIQLSEFVQRDVEEVNVQFDLVPFVEIKKQFDYIVRGNQDTSLLFSPQRLSGNCYLPENMEDEMTDSLFTIVLDLQNFEYQHDTSLPITQVKSPDFVRKVVLEDTMISISRVNND